MFLKDSRIPGEDSYRYGRRSFSLPATYLMSQPPMAIWPKSSSDGNANSMTARQKPDKQQSSFIEDKIACCSLWLRQHDAPSSRVNILAWNVTRSQTTRWDLWGVPAVQAKKPDGDPKTGRRWREPMGQSGHRPFRNKRIDYYTNFIEVDSMTTTTASHVITKLKGHFARYGIPRKLVSDNGPQFRSHKFKSFTKRWGIEHITSSPGHPQANGKAEAAVKIIKGMMRKALSDGTDQYQALLELRNTPRQDFDLSPAQMMLGRRTRSLIPSLKVLGPEDMKVLGDSQKRAKRCVAVKQHHDQGARDLDKLTVNQPVYFQHSEDEIWRRGQVRKMQSGKAYIVEGENGHQYRRNRVHIRPATSEPRNNEQQATSDDNNRWPANNEQRPRRSETTEVP